MGKPTDLNRPVSVLPSTGGSLMHDILKLELEDSLQKKFTPPLPKRPMVSYVPPRTPIKSIKIASKNLVPSLPKKTISNTPRKISKAHVNPVTKVPIKLPPVPNKELPPLPNKPEFLLPRNSGQFNSGISFFFFIL